MRIRGLGRLRRAVRCFKNSLTPRALILLYHRVAEVGLDPWRLCVTPQHFAEHLEIVRKHGRPMQLRQLTQALRNGNLPRRAVVVTFDDGYGDNFYNAKPLLERYDIPATVFAATGYIGHEREFWWDDLDRLLLQPGMVPETLRLSVNGSTYQWDLGEAAHYSSDAYQHHLSWNVGHKDDPTPRHSLYRSLHKLLRPLAEDERRKVLKDVLTWADAESTVRATHRILSPDETAYLAEGELLELGAHTVTHPVLSALPVAVQRSEIRRSKTHLEEILGRSVTGFSYPYGFRADYTSETVAIVREAGFAYACSAFTDVVKRGTDCFQLPRVPVQNWDGEAFARRLGRLAEWFHS